MPDPHRLALGQQPTGAVEAVEAFRPRQLTVGPRSCDDAPVGRRHHGGAVEEADDLLAEVVERATRQDDLHQRAVGVVEAAQHGGLVLEDRAEDLRREGGRVLERHVEEGETGAGRRRRELPVCRAVEPGRHQGGRTRAAQVLDDSAGAEAVDSLHAKRGSIGQDEAVRKAATGTGARQGQPQRQRTVGRRVQPSRVRQDRSMGGGRETCDEAQRDPRGVRLRRRGAARRGGWQVTVVPTRIVGNFHHERTLPTTDSVSTRHASRRSAGGGDGWGPDATSSC